MEVARWRDEGGTLADPPPLHCLAFTPHRSGSLRGFCDLHAPRMRLKFFGCAVHERDGARWVQLPARQIGERDGKPIWKPTLEFDSPKLLQLFSDAAVSAVAAYAPGAFAEGGR